jgi:uncharacterized membrane protein
MARSVSGKERYRTNKQDLDWAEEQARFGENVGYPEAIISSLAGGALCLLSLAPASRGRSWTRPALAMVGAALLHRGITQHCPVYEALGSNTNDLGRRKVATGRSLKLQRHAIVRRRPEELYRYWRDLSNLPRIMRHLESVEVINDRLSHWVVRALPGVAMPKVEWDAEIVNEVENELIGWRSLAGSDVEMAGSVRFRPARNGHGTELIVTLQYDLPGGRLGAALAKLLGRDPERMIKEDLRRFKEAMEARQNVR